MDAIATLYLQVGLTRYRFKIFSTLIGIECQQPGGPNCLLPKDFSPQTLLLYDEQTRTWNLESIMALIEAYPYPDYYSEADDR